MSWGHGGFCDGIFNEAPCDLSFAEKQVVGTPVDFASPAVCRKSTDNGWKRVEFLVGKHMAFPELLRAKAHWPVDYVALIVFVPII